MKTKITNKWAATSQQLFNNPYGRSCHWCKHIVQEGNIAVCASKISKHEGKRRELAAETCGQFKLADFFLED